MQKILLILGGESFRDHFIHDADNSTRNRRSKGSIESVDGQLSACKSHIELVDFLTEKFSYHIDIVVDTVKTDYTEKILDIYKERNLINYTLTLESRKHGLTESFFTYLRNTNHSIYNYIIFVRIDLMLKPYLFEQLRFNNHIYAGFSTGGRDFPGFDDKFLLTPQIFIDKIMSIKQPIFTHKIFELLSKVIVNIYLKTVINTVHAGLTSVCWNPLYVIVNRQHCMTWPNNLAAGKFNPETFNCEVHNITLPRLSSTDLYNFLAPHVS